VTVAKRRSEPVPRWRGIAAHAGRAAAGCGASRPTLRNPMRPVRGFLDQHESSSGPATVLVSRAGPCPRPLAGPARASRRTSGPAPVPGPVPGPLARPPMRVEQPPSAAYRDPGCWGRWIYWEETPAHMLVE
jgi:hypothetical protein